MHRLRFRRWFVCTLLAVVMFGCGGSDGDGGGDVDPSGAPTVTLSCTPTDVEYNQGVVLEWSSTNADSCTASDAWSGEKEVEGSEEVGPLTGNVSFTLSCTGNDLETTETVNVTVGAPPNPDTPSVSLSADPSSVEMNGATTLTWSSLNADTCTASGAWSGDKGLTGEETIDSLTANSTFVLECTGTGGTVSASTAVVVNVPPEEPSVTLSAEPTTVAINGSTTLSWSSSNVDNCTASGAWDGDKEPSGQEIIETLDADSTFTLTCEDSDGAPVNASVDVVVDVVAMGTVTLSWTPPTKNTDGSDLTDLMGYKIHIGTTSGTYARVIPVNDNTIDSYVVDNLTAGTWYFAVSAVDTSGNESTTSNEESKVISIP